MTFWKITLSYDGTAFHGWQVQPSLPTIQGTLAAALKRLTGEDVLPQGSGRTDAGVHALAQVASFPLEAPLPKENLYRALNRALPPSIRVTAVEPVTMDFHARHRAVRKTYEYRIFERRMSDLGEERPCSPFQAPYVWDCRWPLDVQRMHEAAQRICGTHDFTSFAASDPDLAQRDESAVAISPVKTVFLSNVVREDGLVRYRVTGSGFLHHMVRNLVGTLVDIGRGSLEVEDLSRILEARDRKAAGPTAPAQGLFLMYVEYPPTPEQADRQ